MSQNLETAGAEYFFHRLALLEAQNVSQDASTSVVRSTASATKFTLLGQSALERGVS
jgi:hypothetical protein